MARSALLALLLVSAGLLSGCTDDAADPADDASPATSTDPTGGPLVGYAVDPNANATDMMGAHEHDVWGDVTQMLLFEGNVNTADCGDQSFTQFAILLAGAFRDQEIHKGCASITFPSGTIVPEGTGSLLLDIDATDALTQGGMQLAYDNEMTEYTPLEPSTEAVHSWNITMGATEWDLPHTTESTWSFLLTPTGTIGILDGSVAVTIMAQRIPDWEPILASAHIQHWDRTQDHGHDFISDDVMRTLDANVTVSMPSFADRIQRVAGSEPVPLSDIIPPETQQVTVVVMWSAIQGCAPGHACWIVPLLRSDHGNSNRENSFGEEVERTATYGIYSFLVPDPLPPDSTYANESIYSIWGFVRACPNGEETETPIPFFNGCLGEAVSSMSAETRIEVESWRVPADIAALKTRLGIV